MEILLATLLLVAAIILLLLIICHLFGLKSDNWVKSQVTEEEIITLSNKKLFNTNGYLMQSNSEILLGSNRGSFKRFDSVDSAANQQYTQAVGLRDTKIPQMPSRTPPKPPTKLKSVDEKMYRQSSLKTQPPVSTVTTNTAIPRPSPKKQLSAPASTIIPPLTPPIQAKRSPIKKQSTNPFLNFEEEVVDELPQSGKNPFIDDDKEEIFNFESSQSQSFNDDTQDSLRQVEARISKLESIKLERSSLIDDTDLNLSSNLPVMITNFRSKRMERLETKTKEELLSNIKDMSSSLDSTIADLTNSLKNLDSVTDTDNQHLNSYQTRRIAVPPLRSRSLSETQVEEFINCVSEHDSTNLTSSNNNNPFQNGISTLHRTPSFMYLDHYSGSIQSLNMPRSGKNYNLAQIENNARILSKQNSVGKKSDTTNKLDTNCDTNLTALKRAVSCESVSSESSVVLGDLEQIAPPVTGSLCIGLQYDKVNATEEGCELFVTILEAKDLICTEATEGMDTFVRIYLVPDDKNNFGPLQTKVQLNISLLII